RSSVFMAILYPAKARSREAEKNLSSRLCAFAVGFFSEPFNKRRILLGRVNSSDRTIHKRNQNLLALFQNAQLLKLFCDFRRCWLPTRNLKQKTPLIRVNSNM